MTNIFSFWPTRFTRSLTGLVLLLATASTATAQMLTITGTGGSNTTNDVTAYIDKVELVRVSTGATVTGALINEGFETPVLGNGNFLYRPVGATWTFLGNTGITAAKSGFQTYSIPEGNQVALVQNSGNGSVGVNSISQPLTLPAGTYQVRFLTTQRTDNAAIYDQGLVVTVGGVTVGSVTPPANSTYYSYTTNQFAIDANGIVVVSDLVVSTGTPLSPTPIPAGSYNSIRVTPTGNGRLVGNVTVNSFLSVEPGGSLNDGCAVISGAGSFTLGVGSFLFICNAAGITSSGSTGAVQVTGTRSFSTGASYGYTGAAAVTGNGLPGTVANLAINTAGNVTLTAPVAVSVGVGGAGTLMLNGTALTLLSAASGTALVVNAGAGKVIGATAIVQRYIDPSLNAGPGYRHYSAPVSGSTVVDLTTTTGFAPVLTTSYNTSATPSTTTSFPTVFAYDQARLASAMNNLLAFDKGFVVPAGPDAPLVVGRGYAVNIASTQLVDFVGTLTTGDQTLALSRNPAASADAAAAGWQLVGNPYPAPLYYGLVAAIDRPNLDAAIYVYHSTGPYVGTYRTFLPPVDENGPIGNGVLPVAQGFFVRVSAGQTSGSLTFRNSQRLTSPQATTFQRGTADTRPLVQLELRGSTGPADPFYAYATAGATPAFDSQFDAVKLPNTTGLNLASRAEGAPEGLAIDARPVFAAATVLPLTVGVPTAGTYTLSAAALTNLPAGLDAYLSDALTGQTINLSQQPRYAFAVSPAQAQAGLSTRFSLGFSPQAILATHAGLHAGEVGLFPNPAHAGFTVLVPAVTGTSQLRAELLNALGQVVRRLSAALPADGASLHVDTAGLAGGVYILRLYAGPTTLTKRVVLH